MYPSDSEMIEISDFVVPQISKCDVDGNVSKELEGPLVGRPARVVQRKPSL